MFPSGWQTHLDYFLPDKAQRTGRAGTTFGDPSAAAKGDTSKEAQFKKSAGDFSRNDSGAAPPDVGSTVRCISTEVSLLSCSALCCAVWRLC